MNTAKHDIYNLPNFVSLIRILMAPLLFYFALTQRPVWFLAALLFSGFTDVLDGFLARVMNQITDMGSRLDSWGDFTIYTTMAICAWILWPELVRQELISYWVIVISIAAPVTFGRRYLAPLASPFLEAHPEISLELSLADAEPDLTAEDCDVAIRIAPRAPAGSVASDTAPSPRSHGTWRPRSWLSSRVA